MCKWTNELSHNCKTQRRNEVRPMLRRSTIAEVGEHKVWSTTKAPSLSVRRDKEGEANMMSAEIVHNWELVAEGFCEEKSTKCTRRVKQERTKPNSEPTVQVSDTTKMIVVQ